MVGVGAGMTGRLVGSVVMRDTAVGSQQETDTCNVWTYSHNTEWHAMQPW